MTLTQTIKQLPASAGIYQYFDKEGHLLYVGKAKNLKNRVKSYFTFLPELKPAPKLSHRITKMIEQTVSLNYIVVNSEHDALILENSLIKQLNPKYNILLRDDKTYPYIYIDHSQQYPRPDITRKILTTKEIEYFGPFSVGARDILDSVYELCKLVQKKGCLKTKKLCLYYQIDKCLGPCELDISKESYAKELDKAVLFIKNKTKLIQEISKKMEFYAEELRFEEAAQLRDRKERISKSEIKSEIDFASFENYDIFALEHNDKKLVILKIFMRNGKIISSTHSITNLNNGFDKDEVFHRMLIEYYQEKPPIIAPILIQEGFSGIDTIESYLHTVFGKKAQLIIPQRGKKKQLVDLAIINAKELLKNNIKSKDTEIQKELQSLFELQRQPQRIECFDNSHMAGVATVGAMIVQDNSKFDKNSYRLYHLQAKDEYAQMKETLTRRVESFSKSSPPDLWVLDGGATLLKLAYDILESNGVNLDVIAISKEKVDQKAHRAKGQAKDILYTKSTSMKLATSDKRLQWVQNLRDEAHRSAIGFHKKTKLKIDQQSKLLNLKGISPAKIKKLLNHYGTFENIKDLSFEELSAMLNKNDASVIKNLYK